MDIVKNHETQIQSGIKYFGYIQYPNLRKKNQISILEIQNSIYKLFPIKFIYQYYYKKKITHSTKCIDYILTSYMYISYSGRIGFRYGGCETILYSYPTGYFTHLIIPASIR